MACAACTAAPPAPIVLSGPTMGTTWTLTIAPGPQAPDTAERERIDGDVRDTLARIETLMSTWNPDSELSRLNRTRGTEPFAVSQDTYEVFRWAASLAGETGGAFDVTVLPLVEAWGFGANGDPDGPAPDAATIERLRVATGAGQVELDPEGRWVRKRHPDVACDFSGLAPGYAADLLASMLVERGVTDFLVDVGGELVARGRNARGQSWQVAVERPEALQRRAGQVVPLADMAIATSGDYRNYREVDGKRLAHIIDPRTGLPIEHMLASVTVVDARAVRADALATALMVLGPDEGMALARRLDLAALFVVRTPDHGFDERATPRFEALTRKS